VCLRDAERDEAACRQEVVPNGRSAGLDSRGGRICGASALAGRSRHSKAVTAKLATDAAGVKKRQKLVVELCDRSVDPRLIKRTHMSRDRGRTKADSAEDFANASRLWDQGQLSRAFKLFLKLAKRGDRAAELNVGYFHDLGLGVRKNPRSAIRWYMRAHRHGNPSAAHNIGTIHRDREDTKRALMWFRRALSSGNVGSALEIAKLYLPVDRIRAAKYLKLVSKSDVVSEADRRESRKILRRISVKRNGARG